MSRICLSLPGPTCSQNHKNLIECKGTFTAIEFRLDLLSDPPEKIAEQILQIAEDGELSKFLRTPQLFASRSRSSPQSQTHSTELPNTEIQTFSDTQAQTESRTRSDGSVHSGSQDFSLILTLRRSEDGGSFAGSVAEGEELFCNVLKALLKANNWANLKHLFAVDIEDQSDMPRLFGLLSQHSICRIRSWHCFDSPLRSECLNYLQKHLLKQANKKAGEIPKLAISVGNMKELCAVIKAGQKASADFPNSPFILVGMGEYGLPTRILPEKTGSYLSFASVDDGLAPGQLSSRRLAEYRHCPINAKTPVFAIIGKPVAQSKSPSFHNNVFAARKLSAVYIPLLCDNPKLIRQCARLLNLQGASVTIPHKQNIRSILDSESDDVEATGACNTIYNPATKGRTWQGSNTDIDGFFYPLSLLIARYKREGRLMNVCIIGAGGAARSIGYALLKNLQQDLRILFLNRNFEGANNLAREFALRFPDTMIGAAHLEIRALRSIEACNDLIVQTTPVGMDGKSDPLPFYQFTGKEIFYDIIYSPPKTPILLRAESAGCMCQNGEAMFHRQAELQSKIFCKLLENHGITH